MDLSFAINKAALLKLEAGQKIFYLGTIFVPILLNLMQKIDYFVPFSGYFRLVSSQFSASNSAKLESGRIEVEKLLNCLKFEKSGFVYSET